MMVVKANELESMKEVNGGPFTSVQVSIARRWIRASVKSRAAQFVVGFKSKGASLNNKAERDWGIIKC